MKSRAFKGKMDYAEVVGWWASRGIRPVPKSLLPSTGFIVDRIAAGFLYQTDSDMAIIENLIANPFSKPEERGQALDEITQACVNKARELGYTQIIAFSAIQPIAQRALKHGFKVSKAKFALLTQEIAKWDSLQTH